MDLSECDGFYFLPGEEEGDLQLKYFSFADELSGGKKLGGNGVADTWMIAFFRKDEDGSPIFDETMEAIFYDPKTYIAQLAGTGLYGCMLRKTDKSVKWFNDYLKSIKESFTILKSLNK
jgi:hypothetical protein